MATFLGFVSEDAEGQATLVMDAPQAFAAQLLKLAGEDVVVSVKKQPKLKTWAQVKYLRGVVIADIAEACGYQDRDDWQDVYEAIMFKLRPLPDGPFGLPRRESLAKMNLDEVRRLIDDVILFAESTVVGCVIRRPEEVDLERVVDPEWS